MIQFRIKGAPDSARPHIRELTDHFLTIDRLTEYAADCVDLFRASENDLDQGHEAYRAAMHNLAMEEKDLSHLRRMRERFHNRTDIAARMFAITLWEIDAYRTKTINLAGTSEYISPLVDREILKNAKRQFTSAFAENLDPIRYWAAHGSEGLLNEKSKAKASEALIERVERSNVTMEAGTQNMIVGCLMGDELTMTFGGKVICISISERTIELLRDWRDTFASAFCELIA